MVAVITPLRHRTHLDHHTTGPALHQKAALGGVALVQVDRQPQLRLDAGGQGQIGGPAPVEHQRVAHRRRGAVQINHYGAWSRSLGPEIGQQLARPQQLPGAAPRVRQGTQTEAAVEVVIEVAHPCRQGRRIAHRQLHRQTGAVEVGGVATPVLQQPGGIAFIAVGSTHHQHFACSHLRPSRLISFISFKVVVATCLACQEAA